jgi:hypothetical protein
MIKHIVLFKFKEENKASFMKKAKQDLENLVNSIDELKEIEIGINYLNDDSMPDLSLTATFEDKEALKIYATHPEHLKIVKLFKTMAIGRWVVDYEM